jgi:peptide/nickel transport system substrate-binding protein
MTDRPDAVDALIDDYLTRRIDRRQFFKRTAALGLSLSAAGTLLAACGGGGGKSTSGGGEPRKGGVLREGYDRDVSRTDPVAQAWWDAHGFPVQHETLVTRDPDAKAVPMLAESWEVSDDGLVWSFKIRDGLTFHSGAACDAAAVVACFNEFRDPKKGINAGFWTPVKDVTAQDGNVVQVTMKNPYEDFLFVLDNGYSAIYNKAVRDKLGDQYGVKQTDGTGQFTLKEFVPGSHVTVARWDGYPGSILPFVDNKGPAYLDEIRWVVLTEPATRGQEIEQGNIDALHGPAPQDVARLKGNDDLAVIEWPEMSLYMLGLNFKETDLGFDDVRVRQAVSHAIDRDAIVKTVFFGVAEPAKTLVHTAWPYYDSSVEDTNDFDPDKSKSLLDDAGFTGSGTRSRNGKSLSFTAITEADKTEQLVAQAVQQMLSDVGIDMKLKAYGAEYFEKLLGSPQAYMFKQLWSNLLDASLLFADSRFFAPACCNASFSKIPELDAAFKKWQTAGSEDELKDAASDIQKIAADKLPFVPIVTPTNVWVHRKNVQGWAPLASTLYPYYNDVWIEA